MATAVTLYKARDGSIHNSAKQADAYDLSKQHVLRLRDTFTLALGDKPTPEQWKGVDRAIDAMAADPACFIAILNSKLKTPVSNAQSKSPPKA